jgi:putative nucleotidyltransferase with HDIG domain
MIPAPLKEIAAVFTSAGKQAFLVGGAVRDMLRGERAKDWDLATDAAPGEVCELFRARRCMVIPTGIKHGTVTVHFKGHPVEITTFRSEADYRDGRHPESITVAASIEEDLSRRDFTMNAIALELPSGRIVDPFDGSADIKRRLIRCVRDPLERLSEDGLRSLRALRFAAQLGFTLDPALTEAIPRTLAISAKVSMERQRDELDKILASPRPSISFRLMERTGLLALILPELMACRGIEQKGFHRFDVLDHSLLALDFAADEQRPHTVRLAALLHDIGKPQTRARGENGVWTFYQHEKASAELSGALLARLRYSNLVIAAVTHLIAEHMFHYEEWWTDAAVRRFIIRAGEDNLDNLYALRRADAFAHAGVDLPGDFLVPLIERVDRLLAGSRFLTLKDLRVSGTDLIAIGIKPGKRLGLILNELLESVLDDPALNTPETLLKIARNRY